jgi:hypothetical protein
MKIQILLLYAYIMLQSYLDVRSEHDVCTVYCLLLSNIAALFSWSHHLKITTEPYKICNPRFTNSITFFGHWCKRIKLIYNQLKTYNILQLQLPSKYSEYNSKSLVFQPTRQIFLPNTTTKHLLNLSMMSYTIISKAA